MSTSILTALNNPVRLRIIHCLSQRQKNVRELITNCGLSQSAVSQHLHKLRLAGLVTTSRQGKHIYYSLVSSKTSRIAHSLEDFIKYHS